MNVASRDPAQLRDRVRERWDKFTQEDLDRIENMRNEMVDLVQDKYGYAKERAEYEVDKFLTRSSDKLHDVSRDLARKQEELQRSLEEYNEQVKRAARDASETVRENPWIAIAVAVFAGLLLGLALKSSKKESSRNRY